MINYLKGELIEIGDNFVVVECNSVGYEVFMPLSDINSLRAMTGKEIIVYTVLIHREESMSLYGFNSRDTKKGFNYLIKVSGIGPKAAVNILSHYDFTAIYEFIEGENVDALKKIPGIGDKTARKIILDLKGSVKFTSGSGDSYEVTLMEAMKSLGYKEAEIIKVMKQIKPYENDLSKDIKKLLKNI